MKAVLVALPSGVQIGLDKEKTVIGRNPDNDIVAGEKYVSRRHCAVVRKGAGYFLEDLKSSNGTFVNGRRIEETVRLRNNDTISLGQKSRAYQFRRYFSFVRKAGEFVRKPLPIALIAAGVVLVIGLLSYLFVFRYLGRIDVEKGLQKLERRHGGNVFPKDPAFLAAVERRVALVTSEATFAAAVERRREYKDLIESILWSHSLPVDYSLIVWAESEYNPQARHYRSGAAGLWQLMPSTARAYGLRVDRRTDERLDPARSVNTDFIFPLFTDLSFPVFDITRS